MTDGADVQLFRDGVRRATAARHGEGLDGVLDDLGWHDALAEDPCLAVSALFECQGAEHATSAALDHVLARALGGDDPTGTTCVALPPLGRPDAPGRLDQDRCCVAGLLAAARPAADRILVVAPAGDGHCVTTVDLAALDRHEVAGLDPDLRLVELGGSAAAPDDRPPVDWPAALALGQRAIAHELVGAARRMIDLARQHALGRVQFGRPIASFQAVRHRLADSLVALEAADALLAASWSDPSPTNAAMAKAFAGRAARSVARHGQQVLAGTGFTAAHPFHGYVRRVLVLDQLLGGRSLTRALGADVLAARRLPAPSPL